MPVLASPGVRRFYEKGLNTNSKLLPINSVQQYMTMLMGRHPFLMHRIPHPTPPPQTNRRWADFPFYYAPETELRPMHGANMMLEAKRWLQKAMPWWDRRGGRDHIWLMAHDEGVRKV